jgi:hypothetical protein
LLPHLIACSLPRTLLNALFPRTRVNRSNKKIIAVADAAGPGYARLGFARRRKECGMWVFSETERLLLRRFTESDVGNLHVRADIPPGMAGAHRGRRTRGVEYAFTKADWGRHRSELGLL